MKTIKITCLLLLLQMGLQAQSKTQRLDSLFTALYAIGQFSGNVLIAEDGKPFYQKTFGVANLETGQSLNNNTRFLLGSVSKQFTAAAIVMLKETGKLKFDDPLSAYIPELPYPGITLRQLLNHTSGLPDYDALMNNVWDKQKFATNENILQTLIQYHPKAFFAPGQKYQYSNTGYALLALVIERVAKQSFTDYMEQHLFKAFGMSHTLIYTRRARPRKVDNYAIGYVYQDSLKIFVLPEAHPLWKNALWEDGVYGEDGVNSTTGDLLKWDQAVFHRIVLQPADWNEILRPGAVKEGSNDYGFGWHIIDPSDRIAYHSGGWPGYMAYNEQYLDHNRTIIILRNKFTTAMKTPVKDIRAILSAKDRPAAKTVVPG